ncbi:hypothetical protein B0H19DRAFT_77571 [Mycena capillaripes]|nr:hypothetical protein B0H19DRAFT_77571 [Mycena capillaripes]
MVFRPSSGCRSVSSRAPLPLHICAAPVLRDASSHCACCFSFLTRAAIPRREHQSNARERPRFPSLRHRTYDTFQSLTKQALPPNPIAICARTSSIAYVRLGRRHSERAAVSYGLRYARCSVPRLNDLRTPPSTIQSLCAILRTRTPSASQKRV